MLRRIESAKFLLIALWLLAALPASRSCYAEPSKGEQSMHNGNDRDRDRDRKKNDPPRFIKLSNPNPFLVPSDVIGYELIKSDITRDTAADPPFDLMSETWVKPPASGRTRNSFIKITVYPLKTKTESFRRAEDYFYCTTERVQTRADDKPTPGSYTGRKIGDYCWAYTSAPLQTSGIQIRKSSGLIVVQGAYLFKLSNSDDLEVKDSFIDGLAAKVTERLKIRKRPDCDDDR